MIPPRSLTKQGFELQFGVNHLGHFAFVGLVHPHVEDRIVITASLAHKSGAMDYGDLDASRSYHPWQRYQMSKLAHLLHMIELDRRLGAAGRVTSPSGCHPGGALTAVTRSPSLPLRSLPPPPPPFLNTTSPTAWTPTQLTPPP